MATSAAHLQQQAALEPVVRRRRSTAAFLVGLGILLVLLALWVNVKFQDLGLLAWGVGVLAVVSWVLAFWQRPAAGPEVNPTRSRRVTGYALFALCALLAAAAAWVSFASPEPSFGFVSWTCLLALLALAGGLWQLTPPAEDVMSWQQHWSEGLSRRHTLAARVLFGLGLVLVALTIVTIFWLREPLGAERMPPLGWLLFLVGLAGLALTVLIGGGVELSTPADRATPSRMRLLVLAVGGLAGLFITLAALGLTWGWWDEAFGAGIEGWQGPGGWRFWVCAYTLLFGLAVLFASLLFARPEERSNATLRRLLYGYNTVLTGLLLLAALALFNVVVYASFPADYNWTKTRGVYTLSNSSKHILENLKQPVTVFVLLSQGDRVYTDTHTLLDNCRAVTNKLNAEYLTPDLNPEATKRLMERFPEFQSRGLLVVQGDAADPKAPRAFIARDRLTDISRGAADKDEARATRVYKGESVLMTELKFLDAGRVKPKVYFTQGNQELDVSDPQKDLGAGLLREKLKKDNYELATLRFRPKAAEKARDAVPPLDPGAVEASQVPADAKILIIARPREFSPEARAALAEYMKRKDSRLVVLTGPEHNPRTAAPIPTGLEAFLKEFGVDLPTDYILGLPTKQFPDPFLTPVMMDPNSRNPIAVAFSDEILRFYFTRTVRTTQGGPNFRAEVLMTTLPRYPLWAETNYQTLRDPETYLEGVIQSRKLSERVSRDALPVAVTVTDTEKEPKPRLVVFGNAYLAANRFIGMPTSAYYDLLENTLKWLSERPSEIAGIQPLESDIIAYNPARVNWSRMILLPGGLMALGILGLGTGVWVVRRK